MLEALALEPEDTVLEIGTGYGYETALLARLARHVLSVERIPELAQSARENLHEQGVVNAEVVTGDGTLGLAGSAPYDGIVVAAAFFAFRRRSLPNLATAAGSSCPWATGTPIS